MNEHRVFHFKPFDFSSGQKIRITDGPRRGDWEVVAVTGHKLTLRCPVSGREFTWDRFCYFLEEKAVPVWPTPDD